MIGSNVAVRLGIWLVAVALVAGTRLPGVSGAATVLAVAAVAAIGGIAVLVTIWKKAPSGVRTLLFLLNLAFFLLPPSPDAAFASVPGWVVALVFVLALHAFFHDQAQRPPTVDGAGSPLARRFLRFLPAAVCVALLVGAGFALRWLPLRIRSAFELETALGPLLAVALLGGALLVLGALGGMFSLLRRKDPAKAETAAGRAQEAETA